MSHSVSDAVWATEQGAHHARLAAYHEREAARYHRVAAQYAAEQVPNVTDGGEGARAVDAETAYGSARPNADAAPAAAVARSPVLSAVRQ